MDVSNETQALRQRVYSVLRILAGLIYASILLILCPAKVRHELNAGAEPHEIAWYVGGNSSKVEVSKYVNAKYLIHINLGLLEEYLYCLLSPYQCIMYGNFL